MPVHCDIFSIYSNDASCLPKVCVCVCVCRLGELSFVFYEQRLETSETPGSACWVWAVVLMSQPKTITLLNFSPFFRYFLYIPFLCVISLFSSLFLFSLISRCIDIRERSNCVFSAPSKGERRLRAAGAPLWATVAVEGRIKVWDQCTLFCTTVFLYPWQWLLLLLLLLCSLVFPSIPRCDSYFVSLFLFHKVSP